MTGKKPRNDFGELAVLGEQCSDRERRAEAAERELTKVKLLNYLSTRIGEEINAVVTGVEEFGLFVQGIQLPAEGLIHVSALQDDFYRYDRATHTLSGFRSGNCYRLGDPVQVQVARVDVDRRELDFRLVARSAADGRSHDAGALAGKPRAKPPRGIGRPGPAAQGGGRAGKNSHRPGGKGPNGKGSHGSGKGRRKK